MAAVTISTTSSRRRGRSWHAGQGFTAPTIGIHPARPRLSPHHVHDGGRCSGTRSAGTLIGIRSMRTFRNAPTTRPASAQTTAAITGKGYRRGYATAGMGGRVLSAWRSALDGREEPKEQVAVERLVV